MKVLPFLTTALAFVLAASAFFASPASATVLCSVEPGSDHECLEDHVYKGETSFKAVLKSTLTFRAGFISECSGSEIGFSTTGEGGGEKSTVPVKVNSASFSGCSCPVSAQSLPWEGGSVAWTSASNNGTFTASNARIKVECPSLGISCTYGGLSATLKGGSPAALIPFSMTKVSGSAFCATTAILIGEYEVTPTAGGSTFVEKGPRQVILCKENADPCLNRWVIPQELKAKLEGAATTKFEFRYGGSNLEPTCTTSEIKVPFNAAASPLVGTSSTFGFLVCAGGAYNISPASASYRFEVEPKTAAGQKGNATVTMRATETSNNPRIRVVNPGVFTCEYEKKELDFELTGGNPAKLTVSQTMTNVTGGACEGNLTWTASYEITQPKPLWVF